jgi:Na+-transporting NADH:ubiquinone oxidoreductase subunit NqrC
LNVAKHPAATGCLSEGATVRGGIMAIILLSLWCVSVSSLYTLHEVQQHGKTFDRKGLINQTT